MNRPVYTSIVTALLLIGYLSTAAGQTGTIYVDNGIDRNRCRNYHPDRRQCGEGGETAFRSLQAAVNAVQPGTTVLIQPGTYQGGVVLRSGGTESARVILRTAGPGVTIEGSGRRRDALFITEADYVSVEGLTIQNANRAGLRISRSHHVEVRNSVIRDNGTWGVFTDFSDYTLVENNEASGSKIQHGIYISNSSDYPTIRGNRIHDNAAAGLHVNGDASMGGDGTVSFAVIENNIIYSNGRRGASGINLDGVTHSMIRNNLLYDNQASGISLYRIDGAAESHSNQVLNNTIVNGRFSRWALNLQSTENNRVLNNIILNQNRTRGSILVAEPVGEGFESDYNLLMDSFANDGDGDRRFDLAAWQVLGYDLNSVLGDVNELFINWEGGDFRLTRESPAIDAGTDLEQVPADIEGTSRPQGGGLDIGAYEYVP